MGLWQSSHGLQQLGKVQCCATQCPRGASAGATAGADLTGGAGNGGGDIKRGAFEPQRTFIGTTEAKVNTFTTIFLFSSLKKIVT